MSLRFKKAVISLAVLLLLFACDKGKKPYEEAKALLSKSDYSRAKAKAAEVIQNTPNSKYVSQANAIIEKIDKMDGLFNQAEQSLHEKDYKKAITSYEEILTLDTKSQKAIEQINLTKDTYKHVLLQTGNSNLEKGNYDEAIKGYKEILSFEPNNAEVVETINKAEKILSRLKSSGDNAMYYFRIYIQSRGTKSFERAEVARVKHMNIVDELYKLPSGRKYMASRLRAYLVEVEKALDDFASIVEAYEKAAESGNYNKKVLAHDRYNAALEAFIDKYGQPEAWLDSACDRENGADWLKQCKSKIMRNNIVDQWM